MHRSSDEEVGFFSALRECHDMRDREANIKQELIEDESLLLTLNKLFLMKRDGNEPGDYFQRKIRLNAYKTSGQWYEIRSVPEDHFSSEYFSIQNHSLKITAADFARMGFADLSDAGNDGDTLIYDPMCDNFMTAPVDYDYRYVCSHFLLFLLLM